MVKFRFIMSLVVLIVSLFLIFNKLFTPQPIQIALQTGEEITTSTHEYYSLAEVMLLIISAFLIGTTATYIYYNSEKMKVSKEEPAGHKTLAHNYEHIMPLLKPDEKKAVSALIENNGEMLQNKLVVRLGVNKVKATRILYRLEQKNLVKKERHGITNMIKLQR